MEKFTSQKVSHHSRIIGLTPKSFPGNIIVEGEKNYCSYLLLLFIIIALFKVGVQT